MEFDSTQINYSAYYNTDEQVNSGLMAAYDPMGWCWFSGEEWWGASLKTWGNFASDDAITGGKDIGDQPSYQVVENYSLTQADPGGNLMNMWRFYFMGIYRSNVVIYNVKPESPYKKYALAQAKFCKAFYYFYLSRMFGGLPLIDKVPKPDESIDRASIDKTLEYIENLLLDAISNNDLGERSGMKDPVEGLATKASAQALLGKVYIYHKKYTDAIATLLNVANNNQYKLDAFWHIQNGGNLHGVESIFEINHSNVVGESNADVYLFGPRNIGSSAFNDTLNGGWGFNQPTQSLFDAFKAANDEIRFKSTILIGDSLVASFKKNKGPNFLGWENSITGYWDAKHCPDLRYNGSDFKRISNPEVILRLADVYLMLAESYVRTGDNANSLKYVNLVRARVLLAPLSTITLADVKNERRLELALEGERYFDLVRWTGDADKIDADNVLGPLGYTNGTPGIKTKGLFPIPQDEINATSGKLKQNDGY